MHRLTDLAAIVVLVCLGTQVVQADASEKRGENARHANCCATAPCCPDNYCKKPMPCIPCPKWCGTADDYCKKPAPCIPCPSWCGYRDDYCKKPCPDLCLPRNWQFFRCPPCESESTIQAKSSAGSRPVASLPKPLPRVK